MYLALSQAILFYLLKVEADYNPGAKLCLPGSHCVNKVLLELSQVHLCTTYGGSLTRMADLHTCHQEHMVPKASNIYSLSVYRKS